LAFWCFSDGQALLYLRLHVAGPELAVPRR